MDRLIAATMDCATMMQAHRASSTARGGPATLASFVDAVVTGIPDTTVDMDVLQTAMGNWNSVSIRTERIPR
ncbi:hypothetical protein GCM10027167_25610 [Nocardia heshunensis]